MAYRLFRDGKHLQRIRPGRERVLIPTGVRDENGKPVWVEAGRVSQYLDNFFYQAVEVFAMGELLGSLPFHGGWAEQPADILSVITTLKSEDNAIEAEKARNDH